MSLWPDATLAAWAESVRLIPSWKDGILGVGLKREMLFPVADARLAQTTFDALLRNGE